MGRWGNGVGVCAAIALAIALMGCDEKQKLTDRPISMDIYVDATYSNDQVAGECMPDVMAAARLAAASRGFVTFRSFDGDPFRRRGVSKAFDEGVPASREGTSGELEYLEEQASDMRGELEGLAKERPVVGGTPLIDVLRRAARNGRGHSGALRRVLICTDGLFTDVNPHVMTLAEARRAGARIGQGLRGATVDFIGIDASDPDRGDYVESLRPLVEALLRAAGVQMGNWDVELGSEWRQNTIDAANEGA